MGKGERGSKIEGENEKLEEERKEKRDFRDRR